MRMVRRLAFPCLRLLCVWATLQSPSIVFGQQPTTNPDSREAPWDSPRDPDSLRYRKRPPGQDHSSPPVQTGSSSSGLFEAGLAHTSDRSDRPAARPTGASQTPQSSAENGPLAWGQSALGWVGVTILAGTLLGWITLRPPSGIGRNRQSTASSPTSAGASSDQTLVLLETTLRRRTRTPRSDSSKPPSALGSLPPAPPIPEYRRKRRA